MSDIKKIKPALSEGTRDFLPAEVAKRNYIFDTIKSVFRKYGFEQIETPAIEKLETIAGKYGDEGDKLLFKIRSNKNLYYNLSDDLKHSLQKEYPYQFLPKASDKGLRYDLTVPLARYVVMYQDKLAFPFKRFHIGPVWRGDKPQKGRYQEFYQCDADVIGSTSLFNEIELLMIYSEVFEKLRIKDYDIKINNRKLFIGLASLLGIPENFSQILIAIDKLDKIGIEGILSELSSLNLNQEQLNAINLFLTMSSNDNASLIETFKEIFRNSYKAIEGINELEYIITHLPNSVNVLIDTTLARGLDYYTGLIVEVKMNNIKIGSIGGGGRYDNLTEMFGGQNMSGVGISFGIERIYDVMEELNLFPATISQGVKVLFVPRDISVEEFTFQQVSTLREKGIPAEIFLGNVKKQKQFDYVERKNIAYLVEVGDNEKNTGLFRLRNAQTRETRNDLTISDIADLIMAG